MNPAHLVYSVKLSGATIELRCDCGWSQLVQRRPVETAQSFRIRLREVGWNHWAAYPT